MLPINIALEKDQTNREEQEFEVIGEESTLNTELYSVGYFEGIIGLEPSQPEKHSYWSGYQIGSREGCVAKTGDNFVVQSKC